MEQNDKLSETINLVREYAFEILDENSDINVYTNINLLYRIGKNIKHIIHKDQIQDADMDALFLASYIYSIAQAKIITKELDFKQADSHLNVVVNQIKDKFTLDNSLLDKAKAIAFQCLPVNEADTIESQILSDAIVKDFAGSKGRERLKLMYEELILRDFGLSKSNWYDILIPILQNHVTYTNYGKNEVQPLLDKLKKGLKKERKEIENRNDLLIQKELDISDEEIKSLKKGLSKSKGRDDRGIQTLFRNTSKNHYTINRMVDGKARIMITVNSILLSLVFGGVLGTLSDGFPSSIPAIIFALTNIFSATFAIISITPNKTQGNFSEEEIRSKKGNLLYFGNFYNMHYRDFEWAFLQMLQDKDYLYSSMIRDLYYQAQILHKKSTTIRISLFAFLIGFGMTLLSYLIIYILKS
jgi:hypothetical protein